jgi:outer membrane protein assembly factor BamB
VLLKFDKTLLDSLSGQMCSSRACAWLPRRHRFFPARCPIAIAILVGSIAVPVRAEFGDLLYQLSASDALGGDHFGASVDISGSKAIVARYRMPGAPDLGVPGAVYVYDVTTGQELRSITPFDSISSDNFGQSIALDGNLAIIGAPYKNSNQGAAYVFDVTTGQELYYLTGSDPTYSRFGQSVAISGNTAIVGANRFPGSGTAYVFDLTNGSEQFKLTSTDAQPPDLFGSSVAISGGMAVVGALSANRGGPESSPPGAAYVFDVATGEQLFKLTPTRPRPDHGFAWDVAISGNIAIVGDRQLGSGPGTAYLFDLTTGEQLLRLNPSNATSNFFGFGETVDISETTAIVGADKAAYLFDVETGQQILRPRGSGHSWEDFGAEVAIDENTAIVGAPYRNCCPPQETHPGLAYVFDVTPPQPDLPGDYNSNGTVEQADLDQVLLNWGDSATPPPAGWTGDLPAGQIDQDELDGVLLNWGKSSDVVSTAIPEPSGIAIAFVCLGGFIAAHRGARQTLS